MRTFDNYMVDGAPILIPDDDAVLTRTDLDSNDSGRDEAGFMHRILLRSRVKTWEFNYSHLTAEEYAYMKSLFDGKSEFEFTFTEDGTTAVTIAYCSNDSITYKNAATGQYENLKIKIIEC